jgi:ribosomal-protein-serine acetyltransferase
MVVATLSEMFGEDLVTLRRWQAADVDLLYDVVISAREHLLPWLPWVDGFDRDRAAWFTEQCEREWATGEAYRFAITTEEMLVGSASLMRKIGPGGLEISYWLHPAYTGRGLATMAAAALVREAFTLPDIDRVEILHDAANVAGGRVAERLGFVEVGRRIVEPDTPAKSGVDVVWRLVRDPLVVQAVPL